MRKVNLIEEICGRIFSSPSVRCTRSLASPPPRCSSGRRHLRQRGHFAFVDAALIKPLPFRDAAGLVAVFERVAVSGDLSIPTTWIGSEANTVFRSLDIYQQAGAMLSTPVPARRRWILSHSIIGPEMLGHDFYEGEDCRPRRAPCSAPLPGKRGTA